jgi:hypothetical protein
MEEFHALLTTKILDRLAFFVYRACKLSALFSDGAICLISIGKLFHWVFLAGLPLLGL